MAKVAFAQQHVIITGGSSGIGRALANQLTQLGAHVSIIARRPALLEETVTELESQRISPHQRLRSYSANVADEQAIQEAITALTADGYPPDILVTAAGFARPGYVQELPLAIFRQTMDVDFFGTLHPIKAVLPTMIARRRGHIVTISSVAGFLPVFGYTAYGAAKFAVRGFSDVLRQEMMDYGIYVSVVFPPNTNTPGLAQENRYKPPETHRVEGATKALSADQVARAIVRGIEKHQAYILPTLETHLYFLLANGLTGVFRWYLSRIVTQARRESDLRSKV